MAINEQILKEKFKQGDNKAYDYLADNAKTKEDKENILRLKDLLKECELNFMDTGELDFEEYNKEQMKILTKMGITQSTINSVILKIK